MDPHTAAATRTRPCWADLQEDLVRCVGDGVDELKCYCSARGSCTAWRRELMPPSPLLLISQEHGTADAASLPMGRSFRLRPIPGSCFGSNDGWIAYLSDYWPSQRTCEVSLFNAMTADEICLPLFRCESRLVSKTVFAPSPTKDDFTAAAICGTGCGRNRIAYVVAGDKEWTILDPLPFHDRDLFTDVVYRGEGTFYFLTGCGAVQVLRLPDHRTGAPPATVEPLLLSEPEDNLPFDPATSFALPYNKLSDFTRAKNLVFCGDNMYQIWRNTSCRVNLSLPSGDSIWVEENEIFVLKYYPQRQPCWVPVSDLGGYSVFVGWNNAVSIYAEGFPGLKGNCVYCIGGYGTDDAMVYDMGTGRSAPCLPGNPHSPICWYILSDIYSGRTAHHTQASGLAEPA